MAATNPALCRFVDRLILDRFGTANALAEAIGMSASAFSHGVREEGTLSVENCLRLADATGERPSVILKLARKPEMAALSDRLFGGRMTLSRREKELIQTWRELDEDARNAHETLMQITKQQKQRAPGAPSSGSGSSAAKAKPKLTKQRRRVTLIAEPLWPPPVGSMLAMASTLAATVLG